MRSVEWLVVVALAGCAAGVALAQAPPPPPAVPVPGKTTVAGTVIDAVSRRPIGGAVVSLSTVLAESSLLQFDQYSAPYDLMRASPYRYGSVMTGADGRFRFDNVGAGPVALETHNPGWTTAGQGIWEAADPQLGGDWMAVSASMRTAEIVVPLRRVPVLRGRVTDENGDPAAGVLVRLLSRDSATFGRQWRSFYAFRTDDRGLYYFLLYPGEFLVQARPSPGGEDSLRPITANGQRLIYAPGWFGGSQGGAGELVTLRPGDVRADVDFRLSPSPAFVVRGTVTGFQDPTALSLFLMADDGLRVTDPDWGRITTSVDPQGRFEFRPLSAGRYLLRAFEGPQMPLGSHGTPPLKELPPKPTLAAEMKIDLVERDLDLTVPLQAGARISGRVEFDGTPALPVLEQLKNLVIRVDRADGAYSDFRGLFLDPKTFTTIQIPPGRYVIRNSAPQGWRVKSVVHDGRDVVDEPIELGAGDVTNVVMTFTSSRSFLHGRVTGAAERHLRPWVVAFPVEPRLWSDFGSASRRMAVGRIGSAGTYVFELPPGGYFVCALDEPIVAMTPEFLSRLAGRATQVFIAEGERRAQDLPAPARGRE